MFKKALSLLLALMLIITSLSVAIFTVTALDSNEASSDLNVTAESNLFPTTTQSFTQAKLAANDNLVTVTFKIQSEERMLNADWLLTYDGTVLQFDEAANTTGEGQSAKLNVMPCAPNAVINTNPGSVPYGIKGNCTDLGAYYLSDENGGEVAFVTVVFKAIGSGDTTVNLNVSEMRVTHLEDGQTMSEVENETQLVEDGVVVRPGKGHLDGGVRIRVVIRVGHNGRNMDDIAIGHVENIRILLISGERFVVSEVKAVPRPIYVVHYVQRIRSAV